MIGEIRDPKQTSLVEPGAQELWFKWMNDLQSHHKTTAAFVVNKFLFIIWFKYTQNIYTLS